MNIFLAIQNTYEELQIALMRDSHVTDSRSMSKIQASTLFISTIQELLEKNNVELKDISFIAANQGPGPFTTLRVVISSVNGLSFAKKIPLIGIDGLKAFMKEYADEKYPNTVILLNAFNQDVYFAIQSNQELQTGYNKIDILLEQIKQSMPNQAIRFLGNGTHLFQEKIKEFFGKYAYIPKTVPAHCSIEQVGKIGFESWQKNPIGASQLLPLYLKKHPAQS